MSGSHKSKGEATPKEILAERAMEMFGRRGYHGTSVREIVEAAGVTAPTLYYHFGNKEGLYRYILEGLLDEMRDTVVEAMALAPDVRTRLTYLVKRRMDDLFDRPERVRFLYRVFSEPDNKINRELLPPRAAFQALLDLLDEAIRRGEVRPLPLDVMGSIFLGIMNSVMTIRAHTMGLSEAIETLLEPKGEIPVPVIRPELLVDIFLNGVGSGGGR